MHARVVSSLPKLQHVPGVLTRQAGISPRTNAISTLDVEHVRELRRSVELLAKLSRAGQGLGYSLADAYPRVCISVPTERNLQIQLLLLTLGAFRQTGTSTFKPLP